MDDRADRSPLRTAQGLTPIATTISRWEVRDTTTGVTVASGPDDDQPMDEATAVEEARAALEAARNAEADRAEAMENPLALDTPEEIQAAVEELREPDQQALSALEWPLVPAPVPARQRQVRQLPGPV